MPLDAEGLEIVDAPAAKPALDAEGLEIVAPRVDSLNAWTPTLGDKVRELYQEIRQSQPVENLLGRTDAEKANNPALDSAPTTTDEGVMGLFDNKTPIVTPNARPTTALDGLHNWAAGVVNSVASPGGFAALPAAGGEAVFGPLVKKALLLTFGAQGAKMSYDAAKDLVTANSQVGKKDAEGLEIVGASPARTTQDVLNALTGGLMALGGKGALTREAGEDVPVPDERPADDFLPPASTEPETVQPNPATVRPLSEDAEPNLEPESAPVENTPSQDSTPARKVAPEPTVSVPAMENEEETPENPDADEIEPPSRIVLDQFNQAHDARDDIPVSLLQQSQVDPAALAPGYELNEAEDAYEYTAPEKTLTPEQQQAREATAAMANLAASKQAAAPVSPDETKLPLGETKLPLDETPIPDDRNTSELIPVDVKPADIAAASERVERPPDILDSVEDFYPKGVKFDPDQISDQARSARGRAAELMSLTTGEPADQVITGLHAEGLFPRIQTETDLANEMKRAGDVRVAQRKASAGPARQLAEQAKRTELWGADSSKARKGAMPVPAHELFLGDTFTVKGRPVRVTGHVTEAETGRPSSVEVEGAYGRQSIPADSAVQVDSGSLKSSWETKVDALKLPTNGTLHAFGLIPAAWNTLLEGIKTGIRSGLAIKDAINGAIAKLKNSTRNFDEAGLRRHLHEQLDPVKGESAPHLPRARKLDTNTTREVLTARAAREYKEWPDRVEAADGSRILLKNPEGGSIGRRVKHLLFDNDRNELSPAKATWMPNVPDTLRNAEARLHDPKTGNRIYVRTYDDGTRHMVVVRPDGVVLDQKPFQGKLITQFPGDAKGRQRNFPVEWRRKGDGQPQGVSVPTSAGSQRLEARPPLSDGDEPSSRKGTAETIPQSAILDKLNSLKIPTDGVVHAFGLVPAVWNTLIDGVRLAVRGGMQLTDAINDAISRLKAKGSLPQEFDEAGARRHLEQTLGIRQFGEKLQGADDMTAEVKGQVMNTLYTRRPQETDAAMAQRIMEAVGGPDKGRAVFNDLSNGLPNSVRMALGMQVLKSYDAAYRFKEAAQFFDQDLAPHTTDTAQGLAMLNTWSLLSRDGKIAWAQKKIADARRDATDPVRPDIDAAKTALDDANRKGVEAATADPSVQGTAKAAVEDAVANSAETHKGIVMELTEPWASSKYILDTARQHVHAKANELLNKLPRPPQLNPAQHLRAIFDDLAQRAAGIAASHYQGAEPGVILRDKLMQRLGIDKPSAARLATAFDNEFARQVKVAKDALPQRIAAAQARAAARRAAGLPADATETAVDRSIRRQIATTKQNLGTIVRQHWTKVQATGEDLKTKLVNQAGLTDEAAQKLADIIQRRFEALTSQAKKTALNQLLKPIRKLGLAKPQLVEKLVQMSHLGALDDKAFWNAVQERMNLPEWTGPLRDALNSLADRIGRIPEDRIEDLQRAQTEFLNTLERAKGISNLELGLAFYMQNILSGVTTHVRVAIHTSAQMMAATTAEVAQAIRDGRVQDIPLLFEALAKGAGKAVTQQKDIMRTGVVVGSKLPKAMPLSTLEHIKFGEKGGTTAKQGPIAKAILENRLASILNLWKYNGRLITAQHMLYFAPAEEMKLALLATRQARTEGLQGQAAVDRARQILGYGAAQVRAAEAQAIREGLEGTKAKMRVSEILRQGVDPAMRNTARDYALRQTFLNQPYGFAGAISDIVNNAKQSGNAKLAILAKVLVPFTRIAANLFNEGLNYTPMGAARAALAKTELLGHKFADITPEVRGDLQRELYAKSALGSMLLTGIAWKAVQGLDNPNPSFTVYGQGPSNPQDKAQWRASGGIPYSVKIGDRYVSYANTPGNVMLATLGNYLDGTRDAALYKRAGAARLAQDLPMRAAAATLGAGKVILEQPFLASLLEISQMAGEQNAEVSARQAVSTVTRMASSFVVPNLLRQTDRFFDPTAYDTKSLSGILTSQVPFVRQTGKPMLNALGQPIQSPVFGQFTSPRTADPLVQTLADHNAWPTLPDRNRAAVRGVPLSDDEFYTYAKTRGEALGQLLGDPKVATLLDKLASTRDQLNQAAASSTNPVQAAKLQHVAADLQSKVMARYEAIADQRAAAAVIRQRGY